MSAISRLDEARHEIRRVIVHFLDHEGLGSAADRVEIDTPTEKGRGDLTTSFALKVQGVSKTAPRDLLKRLIPLLGELPFLERFEVAGPGFLNFTLKTVWLADTLHRIQGDPAAYGTSNVGHGQRVLLEYVSANPTGPMVVVSGRAAAVGDTLARVMRAVGYEVSREFYINDAGRQIVTLGHAVVLRLRELDGEDVQSTWPQDVYPGDYVKDLALQYRTINPSVNGADIPEAQYDEVGAWAAEAIRRGHEESLRQFGVTFDRWFSERTLRESRAPEAIVDRLKERGYVEERDGALWFVSTRFGDDKDRVMVRSDGTFTYFVPDAAYHADKFDRGFDYVIDFLGPDHHGYVSRMRAVVEALGYPPARLEILIVQLVRLLRDGELVRMSKRGGSFVALEDLIDEAGVDPVRFFFLERAPETPLDFNLNLATLKGSDNPVYYVQYAGARIHSILKQRQSLALAESPWSAESLTASEEREIIVLLARFPEVLVRVASERAPQHLPKYLTELAAAFHGFYRQHRILDAPDAIRQARLALAEAVLVVLTRGLQLMGISQPEAM